MDIHPAIAEYLALAFEIEKHMPGFIDAYTGPAEIRERAEAGGKLAPAALLDRANALDAAIQSSEIEPERKRFLAGQLRAEIAIARKLSGEVLPYKEEVSALFDIAPEYTPERVFADAIAQLDDLLPGNGSAAERMTAYRDQSIVSPEAARQIIDRLAAEARRRTLEIIELPEVESVEFRMVQNQPWSGYNWFLGNGKSRVEINTDLPIRATSLPDLIAHEAYPGHHAEHSLKEIKLFREKGWAEYAVQLINTPECVISEGIATLAGSWIFDSDEAERWIAAEIERLTGIRIDPERERAVGAATRALRAVGSNVALMVHADGASQDEAIAYLVKYGLETETRARHRLQFINDPLWRAYIFCYHAGRDLLAAWLAKGPESRNANIRTLMLTPITPSWVAAQL